MTGASAAKATTISSDLPFGCQIAYLKLISQHRSPSIKAGDCSTWHL